MQQFGVGSNKVAWRHNLSTLSQEGGMNIQPCVKCDSTEGIELQLRSIGF